MDLFDEYEDDYFLQEIDQEIDDALGQKASESAKFELKKSLISILRENSNQLYKMYRTKYNDSNNAQFYDTNRQSVNIFLFNSQPNIFNSPVYQPPNPAMNPTPFTYNAQQIQVPPIPPPSIPMMIMPFSNPNNSVQTTEKVHKSKKHHHHHHHDKKEKMKKSSKKSSNKTLKKSSKKTLKKSSKKNEKFKIETIDYSSGNYFIGIFNFLTTKFGQNPHDKGEIEITTNSMNTSNPISESHPKNLITPDSRNYKAKGLEVNAWICFDFKKMSVEISSYSVKSSSNSLGHIKNWVIEISNDNENWTVIDTETDAEEMDCPSAVRNYKVLENKFSRYCRFRHNGPYWGHHPNDGINSTYIEFNHFEIFGKIKIPKE